MITYQSPHKVSDIIRHYSLDEREEAISLGSFQSLATAHGEYSFKVVGTQEGYFWVVTCTPETDEYYSSLNEYQEHTFKDKLIDKTTQK